MAADVVTLQARLDAISTAFASGVLIVRHGDTSTQFRNLAEMERIIATLTAQINGLSATPAKRVRYIYQSGKGL